MELIKKYTYKNINKLLLTKTVHFISDCEFFPNFNITGKVISIHIHNNEILFEVKIKEKKLTIGSNMKNLQFEIV